MVDFQDKLRQQLDESYAVQLLESVSDKIDDNNIEINIQQGHDLDSFHQTPGAQ